MTAVTIGLLGGGLIAGAESVEGDVEDVVDVAGLGGGDPGGADDHVDDLLEGGIGAWRRLILTSRTFAQNRRTYDSLAAERGVGRERVRQLEASALQQLAGAAAHERYRPLRWRAASAAQPGREHAAVIPGTPPWLRNMLSWLAGKPA